MARARRPRAKLRPDGTCTTCDLTHDPRKCVAHNQRGLPCGRWHIRGGFVCQKHGGAASTTKRKAAERIAEEAAAKAVVTLGLPIDISPTDALLGEVAATAGHVKWLLGQVRELSPTDLAWGVTERRVKEGLDRVDNWDAEVTGDDTGRVRKTPDDWGTTTTQKAAPSIWYELYTRERAHLVRVCSEALRAGIEERRVQLAETQGALVAEAIRRILEDLGLSVKQRSMVAEIVPRHLRAIAGGGAS
ncbi:MAG TPA: hypothetical protein VIM47_00815 [Dermatophilaceae bacterium]